MAAIEETQAPCATPAESLAATGGPQADGPANPTALTLEQLAKMLAVPVERVRDHVAAGAPTGPGGTINLVNYAAWLNRRLKELDGD
jgi:hypothetical protein